MRKTMLAVLFAGLTGVGPAMAAVDASAIRVPQNPNHVILGSSYVNTGDFANATIDSTIGGAFASASSKTGRLFGQAGVTLSTADPYASGVFSASALAFQDQKLRFGQDFCTGSDCVLASSLGVDSISITYDIRASGGVSAFAGDPRFDRASASIAYVATLFSASQSSSAGGNRYRDLLGNDTGDISSQSLTLGVRPGQELGLQMSFTVTADGALSSFANSGQTSAAVTALADFAHTLEWGGVTGFQAYDADGKLIDLDPRGRFTLLNPDGLDFWYSAANGFRPAVAGGVPEPATWALMIGGLVLVGGMLRRRAAAA
jgi:hypothetical protein